MFNTFKTEKKIVLELANKIIGEIQNLSSQIDFNNLIYYFNSESCPKNSIGFEGPLGFYKSTKDGYRALEKAK